MSVSVADIVLGQARDRLDGLAPKAGGAAILGTLSALISSRAGNAMGIKGADQIERLVGALTIPLPRVLVSAWRKYDEFLPFAATEERPASSGEVEVVDQEIEAHWELAPRVNNRELENPRIEVTLRIRIGAGTVEVERGRFAAIRAGTIDYDGSLRLKEAPEDLIAIEPASLKLPGGRLDFGGGWPIRPR